MKERLVWRPNNISPEQWEKLSRDEQISWWQEREPRPVCPPSHPSSFVKHYQQGILTAHEFALDLFESLTEENGAGFLETCPEDLLSLLQERAAAYPDAEDDEAWRQMMTIRAGCYPPGLRRGKRLLRWTKNCGDSGMGYGSSGRSWRVKAHGQSGSIVGKQESPC
jgi:hypothetical protein